MADIIVKTIVEMLGAPKEHIEKTLKDYIEKLKKEGLDVLNQEFFEAKKQERLYSAFMELEIKFKELPELLRFCVNAMPSSFEVLEPGELSLKANQLADFLNELQSKLHETDMIVKTLRAQQKLLDLNSTAVFYNFILYAITQGPKSLEELSRIVGVKHDDLMQFLKKLEEKKRIKKEGESYMIEDELSEDKD